MAWKPYSKPLFAHWAILCDNNFDNSLMFCHNDILISLNAKSSVLNEAFLEKFSMSDS